MTINLLLPDITDAISKFSIADVVIKDVDEIAASWNMTANVLYPNPNGFITGLSLDYQSLLRGTNAPVNITYTLNYTFLGTKIGDMSNFTKAYSNVVNKTILIIEKMISNDAPYSGKVDMEIVQPLSIGPKSDPAGNGFHGADITLRVTEMQN